MDRLSIVAIALATLVVACGDKESTSGSSRSRVDKVAAKPAEKVDPTAMCDKHYAPAEAPAYVEPEVVGPVGVTATRGWRWVNVWATWCKPCVEELPRLASWPAKLASAGTPVSLQLISADESDDEIEQFRKQHAGTPATSRLADPDSIETWIGGFGVSGATLPVHIFVDPTGNVRCVRASEIEESDYPAIAALLAQ